jgi:folate-binding protein YgfZ
MEINEIASLDNRGFVEISGEEAKDFLQNIVTNDIEKITESFTIFSSIFTPQGKYLYEFFISKIKDKYLLECEKEIVVDIIKTLNIYKLRSKIDLIDVSKQYISFAVNLETFKEINKKQNIKSLLIFADPRNQNLGAKIIINIEDIENIIHNFNLKKIDKHKYYEKSFSLGIPQLNLNKLKDKIFGIENNLDELGGIDFKKGCYIGQENTSRIKLRNKLRKRILPIQKISGEIKENDIIKYGNNEVGKIMIDKPYPFGLIKIADPKFKEFINTELECGNSKIKILKPEWI